ncbi:MAG: GspH/FimT family protein, partial [Proteobacteria bacterium]|nr:GspH/FimT family protein [Pseudomonadota bacterium]
NERNRLTVSLNFARSYAIKNQQHIIICPSNSGNGCDNQSRWYQGWIIFKDDNKNRQLDDGELLLQHENAMQTGITVTSSRYRQKIRYNGMGFSPGTNLSINFCDVRGEEFAQAIILNNAGRIKQSKPISDNVCN